MTINRQAACCALGALAIASGLAFAQGQESFTCATATFAQDVVERFPRIRDACYEVVQRPDGAYAVFKADVVRVQKDGLDVRFEMRNGDQTEVRHIKTLPEFTVDVHGKSYQVHDLAVGQDLTAYIKLSEPVVALAQPAAAPPAPPVALEPPEPAPPPKPTHVARAMPQTSSSLPVFGLLGTALVCLAGLTRRLRTGV